MKKEEKRRIEEILKGTKQKKVNEIIEQEKARESEEKRKAEEIMKATGQSAVNKIIKGEKNKILKEAKEVEEKHVKRYLTNSPNPQQRNVDKIIKEIEEKER